MSLPLLSLHAMQLQFLKNGSTHENNYIIRHSIASFDTHALPCRDFVSKLNILCLPPCLYHSKPFLSHVCFYI